MIKQTIIFCLLSINWAFAQKLDLAQLTKLGLDQNRDLALAINRVEMQKALVNSAFEMPKMKMDLQVGNIQTPFVTDYTFGIVQNAELPKVYKLRKTYNESLVKLGESQYEILKNEYGFSIANIYYELLYLHQTIEALLIENNKIKEIEKVYKRRQEEGETDGSEAANMHLRILENEMKISRITFQKNDLEGRLKLLLNSQILPELSFLPAQALLKNDVSKNDRLTYQNYLIESSQIATGNEQNRLLPSINLGVMNQSMLGSWRQFIGVVGVEIPLFSKAQKARVEASKISTKIQESEFEKVKFQLESEIISLQKNLQSTDTSIALIKDSLLPESERIMQTVMKKYLAGQIDYMDWYLVYNQNLNYKMELLSLEKTRNIAISNIKYLIGNE
ncbi:MAG: TolC family protein [Leadbetterella sp.]|nr:TolC family protein [Leadbetterella sp.]